MLSRSTPRSIVPTRPRHTNDGPITTPQGFRFAVKLPKQITHVNRLVGAETQLARFFLEIAGLGAKLGPILVQLPPSLDFIRWGRGAVLRLVAPNFSGPVVCEPRHASWFQHSAESLLEILRSTGSLPIPRSCPRQPIQEAVVAVPTFAGTVRPARTTRPTMTKLSANWRTGSARPPNGQKMSGASSTTRPKARPWPNALALARLLTAG